MLSNKIHEWNICLHYLCVDVNETNKEIDADEIVF